MNLRPTYAELNASLAEDQAPAVVPETLADWLGRVKLLYGIPFEYLVPEETQLPAEALRFFYVDLDWLACLVDGAFSPGRATSGDLARDRAQQPAVHAAALESAAAVRAGQGRRITVATGFLLRSAVVAGWPGLEVEARGGEARAVLPILRLDRPAPDLLFGIFEGDIQELTFHEPAEALHFGFDLPDDARPGERERYGKQLKSQGTHTPAGTPLAVGALNSIPMRSAQSGVVRVARLAAQLTEALRGAGELAAGATLNSDRFALQMTEGVGLVRFRREV